MFAISNEQEQNIQENNELIEKRTTIINHYPFTLNLFGQIIRMSFSSIYEKTQKVSD